MNKEIFKSTKQYPGKELQPRTRLKTQNLKSMLKYAYTATAKKNRPP